MAYNYTNQQYLLAAQMQAQQQQVIQQQQQQTVAEQHHQAAAALELERNAQVAANAATAAVATATAEAAVVPNPNALAIRRPFDPTAHELDANFRLTRFADLKGRGCKVPQEVLLKLLEGIQDDGGQDSEHFMHMAIPRIGKNNYFLWNDIKYLMLKKLQ